MDGMLAPIWRRVPSWVALFQTSLDVWIDIAGARTYVSPNRDLLGAIGFTGAQQFRW